MKLNLEQLKNTIKELLSVFFQKVGKITQTVTQKNILTYFDLGVFELQLCSYIIIMFPNLNSFLALPTLVTSLTSSGLQAGAIVQDRSSN
jgi:hypothetical protein